jgi:hypothetical protein
VGYDFICILDAMMPKIVFLLALSAVILTQDNPGLRKYKKSPHHLFVGYLVGDGNDPYAGINPANAPDSADFLEFFAGRDSVRSHWREAQAKGTRIVVCFFPNSIKGYTLNGKVDYEYWAKNTFEQIVKKDSLDGIDIDIESGTFGGPVPVENAVPFLKAVAKYFGPNSTHGKTVMGNKPTFFFDTDGSFNNFNDGPIYTPYKSNYDYVLFQAYTNGNRAWRGNGIQDFPPLIKFYGADKLIYLVNGDDFTGSNNHDQVTDTLFDYAHWVVQNNAIGVGAYRMSRDYDHHPHFYASRTAIQIMNPAKNP